jgi:hypothetical protein
MGIKMFAWLLINDRLNTRDLLKLRNWRVKDDDHCELSPGRTYVDRQHLLFECNFSQRVWSYLQITWETGDDMMQLALKAKRSWEIFLFRGSFYSLLAYLEIEEWEDLQE